jgi:hypothetical protein
MNLGTSLAAYATIARETGRPFSFPGSPEQYNGLVDVTDARLVANHMIWSSTTTAAANTAFNVVNDDVFRWRRMWSTIANHFGIEAGRIRGAPFHLPKRWRMPSPSGSGSLRATISGPQRSNRSRRGGTSISTWGGRWRRSPT